MRRPSQRSPGAKLSAGLVGERALVGTPYLADRELRRAYHAEIAPRTRAALDKIFAASGWPVNVRRVLDLGAGTGAAGDAARARFGAAIDVVAVDNVPAPGVVVADLRRPGRPKGVEGRFDLVLAAHMLNELVDVSPAARAALVLGWMRDLLAADGACVLVEPALRETARALLDVRDRLLAAGVFVAAPCLWAGACPALERPRDWCHDAAPWPADAIAERGARGRVDFSYLVLTTQRPTDAPAGDNDRFRIVSDLLDEKGRLRVFGCGPRGRHPLVRQDRQASPSNEAFGRLVRGMIARVAATETAGDGLRVGPETIVRIEDER